MFAMVHGRWPRSPSLDPVPGRAEAEADPDVDSDVEADAVEVRIVDDVALARGDTDSVTEDGPVTADGNVITGSGGTAAPAKGLPPPGVSANRP